MTKNNIISRFLKVKVALAGLIVICIVFLVAIFAYGISPDNSPNANAQQITLSNLRPGEKINFIKIRENKQEQKHSILYQFMFGCTSTYKSIPYCNYKITNDSVIITEFGSTKEATFTSRYHIIDAAYAINEDSIIKKSNGKNTYYSYGGIKQSANIEDVKAIVKNQIESRRFLLGTDRFGRDLLSRIIVGSRISMSVGVIAVAIALIVGVILGLLAGYFGGMTDRIIMWLINVVWSIPTLLLVIAISMVLGKGFWQIFIAVGLTMWVEVARVVRGQVKSITQKDYVQAAHVLGFSNFRVMFKHILPNINGPLIVISAANFATAILLEAGLSFLGIGVQPPMPSWGNMIRDHYGYIVVDQAYLAIVPGLAIMIVVWAFTVLGYGLRDALDVKN